MGAVVGKGAGCPSHPSRPVLGVSGKETHPLLVPAHLRGWRGLGGVRVPPGRGAQADSGEAAPAPGMAKRSQKLRTVEWQPSPPSRLCSGGMFPIVFAWFGHRAAETLCLGGWGVSVWDQDHPLVTAVTLTSAVYRDPFLWGLLLGKGHCRGSSLLQGGFKKRWEEPASGRSCEVAGIIRSFGGEESRKHLQNSKCNFRRKFLTFGEGQEGAPHGPAHPREIPGNACPCVPQRRPSTKLGVPAPSVRGGCLGEWRAGPRHRGRSRGCRDADLSPGSGRGQPLARAPETRELPSSEWLWERWPRSARGCGCSIFGPRLARESSARRCLAPKDRASCHR